MVVEVGVGRRLAAVGPWPRQHRVASRQRYPHPFNLHLFPPATRCHFAHGTIDTSAKDRDKARRRGSSLRCAPSACAAELPGPGPMGGPDRLRRPRRRRGCPRTPRPGQRATGLHHPVSACVSSRRGEAGACLAALGGARPGRHLPEVQRYAHGNTRRSTTPSRFSQIMAAWERAGAGPLA